MNKKFWFVTAAIITLALVFSISCILFREMGNHPSVSDPQSTAAQGELPDATKDGPETKVPETEQMGVPETEAAVPPPWEEGGKLPCEYTWDEFKALSAEHQELFFEWFASPMDFAAWQKQANDSEQKAPWEEGGKLPSEYTWEEFEALSAEEQELFFAWFDSAEDFAKWQEKAKGDGTNDGDSDGTNDSASWEEGGKLPSEYTWEEFQALSAEEQELFFEWFESAEAFAQWQKWAQSQGGSTPWENGGKQPDEYTWEEFEALSAEEQELFFEWFESAEAFTRWQEWAQSQDSTDAPWENGGKLPNEYTWEEFQALSAEHQELFFAWFESAEAFQEWMEQANP